MDSTQSLVQINPVICTRDGVAGAWLVLEDLTLVQFELYEGTGWNPPSS